MNLDPRHLVSGPWGRFGGSSAADVSLILTLLLLIFHFHTPNEPWYLRTPLIILAVAGFVWPHLRRSPRFWFVISTVLWSVYTERWWLLDNHEFLIGY